MDKYSCARCVELNSYIGVADNGEKYTACRFYRSGKCKGSMEWQARPVGRPSYFRKGILHVEVDNVRSAEPKSKG